MTPPPAATAPVNASASALPTPPDDLAPPEPTDTVEALGTFDLPPARGLSRLLPEGFRRIWNYGGAYRRDLMLE